jgi:hypothetical protein
MSKLKKVLVWSKNRDLSASLFWSLSQSTDATGFFAVTIEGNPAPEVKWFRGIREIVTEGRYMVKTDGATNQALLFVKKARHTDEGKYRIVATNSAGTDEAEIQLFVSGKPWPFTKMAVTFQYSNYSSISSDWLIDCTGFFLSNSSINRSIDLFIHLSIFASIDRLIDWLAVAGGDGGMDFRAMLAHRKYSKWGIEEEDPNWGDLKHTEEEKPQLKKRDAKKDYFLKELFDLHLKQGKDKVAHFECVYSRPDQKPKWTRGKEEIFHGLKFKIVNEKDKHVMEIKDPKSDDSGQYVCTIGDSITKCYLQVDGKVPLLSFCNWGLSEFNFVAFPSRTGPSYWVHSETTQGASWRQIQGWFFGMQNFSSQSGRQMDQKWTTYRSNFDYKRLKNVKNIWIEPNWILKKNIPVCLKSRRKKEFLKKKNESNQSINQSIESQLLAMAVLKKIWSFMLASVRWSCWWEMLRLFSFLAKRQVWYSKRHDRTLYFEDQETERRWLGRVRLQVRRQDLHQVQLRRGA